MVLKKSTSRFLTSFLIGLIVVSFMFTGYESLVKSNNHVAKVGDYPIPVNEFEKAFQNQLEFYKKVMQGRTLTQKQIRQFQVRRNTLEKLINEKLLLNLADDFSVSPSKNKIKEKIKGYPYFTTNDRFDLTKYKKILAINSLTPKDFEEQISHEVKIDNISFLISPPPVSKGFLDSLKKFHSQQLNATLVKIKKENLVSHLTITPRQIDGFINNADNLKELQDIFKKRKPSLDKPEKIKVSHILMKTIGKDEKQVLKKIKKTAKKLTKKNFSSIAKQVTEDPQGKKNGGSLGWIARGKMVPQFDKTAFSQKEGTISKPIKTRFGYHIIFTQKKKKSIPAVFENHKRKLTKEILQKKDSKQLNRFVLQLKKKILSLLKKNHIKKLESLKKKYELTLVKNKSLNHLDGRIGHEILSSQQIFSIFKDKKTSVLVFDDPSHVLLIKKGKIKKKEPLNFDLSRRFNDDLIKWLKDSKKIRIYQDNILNGG